jgi:ABC-type multidrug transport system fused ATPase/permease subunit
MISANEWECYVPVPILYNTINVCLPIYAHLANTTLIPFEIIAKYTMNSYFREAQAFTMLQHNPMFFCFHTLPPSLQLSIMSLSLILLVCASLTIQDYASGLYSYSLIHRLRSSVHWSVTFVTDLLLCLLWLLILVLIARFVHPSSFDGRFFALTPLYFIANLPFIYLIGRLSTAPILGATIIVFILQFTQILNTFKVLIELFRGYRTLSTVVYIVRWLLIFIFPNVNVLTLIVAALRPYSCASNDAISDRQEEFVHEQYSHKILIHTLIFIGQLLVYFTLLMTMDTCRWTCYRRRIRTDQYRNDDDNDVEHERQRIETMSKDDRQHESLIVDNLSKFYSSSRKPAVNRLTFAVPQRQCFGLLGFNGSGKNSLDLIIVTHRSSRSFDCLHLSKVKQRHFVC